jgi:hypothetical protein
MEKMVVEDYGDCDGVNSNGDDGLMRKKSGVATVFVLFFFLVFWDLTFEYDCVCESYFSSSSLCESFFFCYYKQKNEV